MESSNVIETFESNEIKINLFKAETTNNTFAYGGNVYYQNKFIKYIPALTGVEHLNLLKKYAQNLINKLYITEYGIRINYKDSEEGEYYHVFPEFQPLFN
jgi:hypothetical protein